MADLPGTNILGPIVPYTSEDNYPTHKSKYGKGGHRTEDTIVERNNIPKQRRELLMTVGVVENRKTYKLINNPDTDTTIDSDWEDITVSGTNINVIDVDSTTNLNLNIGNYYDSKYIYSCTIKLNTTNRYGKITWCLEVGETIPTLTFSDRILWRYDNDLDFVIHSFNVFEFETWNNGTIWLGKVSRYSYDTPENQITEQDVEGLMGWKTL
jgi:hypothetical protein